MAGAGFARDMANSSRNNRSLLKGDGGGYSSFDASSYGHPTNKTEPKFKEATPEVLAAIREEIEVQNQEAKRQKRIIILSATIGAIICLCLIFLIKF